MNELNKLPLFNVQWLVKEPDEEKAIYELRKEAVFYEEVETSIAIAELKERRQKYHKHYGNLAIDLQGQLDSRKVWLFGNELQIEESQNVYNHSSEFCWGYGGSGPAQLALAICIKLFGEEKALEVYQDFKFRHIAALPQTDFETTICFNINDL